MAFGDGHAAGWQGEGRAELSTQTNQAVVYVSGRTHHTCCLPVLKRGLGDSSKLPPMVVDGGARFYDGTPDIDAPDVCKCVAVGTADARRPARLVVPDVERVLVGDRYTATDTTVILTSSCYNEAVICTLKVALKSRTVDPSNIKVGCRSTEWKLDSRVIR